VNKDLAGLARFARQHGWDITQGRSHLKWYGPEGQLVVTSRTPSDRRAIANVVAVLRRHGLAVPTNNRKKKQ